MPKKLTRRKSNLQVQKGLNSLTKKRLKQLPALTKKVERLYRTGDWAAMGEPLADGFLLMSPAFEILVQIPEEMRDGRSREIAGWRVDEIRNSLREELAPFLSELIKEMIRVREKKEHAEFPSLLQRFRLN
jgi:hypothetical protein